MHVETPRQVVRWSVRLFTLSAPTCIIILGAWVIHLLPPGRPVLALMLYLMALTTTAGSAVVGAVASCHVAIGRAFSAGIRVGQESTRTPAQRPGLRAVE